VLHYLVRFSLLSEILLQKLSPSFIKPPQEAIPCCASGTVAAVTLVPVTNNDIAFFKLFNQIRINRIGHCYLSVYIIFLIFTVRHKV
jgi:hypothetical protein